MKKRPLMLDLGRGIGPRGAKGLPPPGLPGHPDSEAGEMDSSSQEYAEGESCDHCGGEYGPNGKCEECGAEKPEAGPHKGKGHGGVSLTIVLGHAPTRGMMRHPKR